MGMVRIQVCNDQHDVGEVFGVLAVTDKLFVINRMESQAPVALQGRVFSPDPVDPTDKSREAVPVFDVPVPDLVLFGVQVFFAAKF